MLICSLEPTVIQEVREDMHLGIKGIVIRRRQGGTCKAPKPELQVEDEQDEQEQDEPDEQESDEQEEERIGLNCRR